MWAQMIKTRVKDGSEAELRKLFQQLRDTEQADSGLVRTLAMRDQNDPSSLSLLVVFESEEKARAREEDPRRQEALQRIRGALGDVLTGPPEFFDCDVLLNK